MEHTHIPRYTLYKKDHKKHRFLTCAETGNRPFASASCSGGYKACQPSAPRGTDEHSVVPVSQSIPLFSWSPSEVPVELCNESLIVNLPANSYPVNFY